MEQYGILSDSKMIEHLIIERVHTYKNSNQGQVLNTSTVSTKYGVISIWTSTSRCVFIDINILLLLLGFKRTRWYVDVGNMVGFDTLRRVWSWSLAVSLFLRNHTLPDRSTSGINQSSWGSWCEDSSCRIFGFYIISSNMSFSAICLFKSNKYPLSTHIKQWWKK